ncbi:MAG: methylcobamide--CoM methyltransferase [Anaerolineae bacterium]
MVVTVVGNYPKTPNLPRPQMLRRAINQFDRGEIEREELVEVENQVTREVIDEQVEAGVELVTDGMIRWDDGQTYLAGGLDGFSINGLIRYFDNNTYYRQPVAEGPIRWKEPITVDDYRFAASHSPVPVKPVLTGPYTLARLSQIGEGREFAEVLRELAHALNQEARALSEAGATLVQFDEPSILEDGSEVGLFAEAAQTLVEGLDAQTALYTYFGDAGTIWAQVESLPFDLIGLDFVSGPANYDLIADRFPKDKLLGAGVVDGRNTRLEEPDEVAKALERVSAHVPMERLHVNPSCGLDFLPREVAETKLQRLSEGAGLAQGRSAG